MAIVYKITNKINNKMYIGMTVRTIEERFRGHITAARGGSKFRFHSAIRKYGIDNWVVETLEENEDTNKIRELEVHYILTNQTMHKNYGYNAKPGGCGGWIVPESKYEVWLQKQQRQGGESNGNYSGLSNECLYDIVKTLSIKLGRVPGLKTVRKHHLEVPKNFSPFRYGGKYPNLAKLISEDTGLIYDPYFRSDEQRELARKANTGRISPQKGLKVITAVDGKRKYVKN